MNWFSPSLSQSSELRVDWLDCVETNLDIGFVKCKIPYEQNKKLLIFYAILDLKRKTLWEIWLPIASFRVARIINSHDQNDQHLLFVLFVWKKNILLLYFRKKYDFRCKNYIYLATLSIPFLSFMISHLRLLSIKARRLEMACAVM